MNFDRLYARLKLSEGWRERAYLDTADPPCVTWGFGINVGRVEAVDSAGRPIPGARVKFTAVSSMTIEEGTAFLVRKVAEVYRDWSHTTVWFERLDPVRQEVIVDLGFNMGVAKVMGFSVFMGQMTHRQYEAAAKNMRSWDWYGQVHAARAEPLCRMMETGKA